MAVECAKNELMIFEPKAVQYSVIGTEQIALKPIASIDNSTVITFLSQGFGDFYRNLESIYVVVKVQMQHFKDDGTELTKVSTTTLNVAPCNNLLHSLFKQITLKLNGRQVSLNTHNYAYKAYIENILNYSEDAANSHLDTIIFKPDTPKFFSKIDTTNKGAQHRGLLFQPNEPVELIGRLHLDMLNCRKYMLNNVDVEISFDLNKPDFYLQKTTEANQSNLKILDFTLYMDHVQLNPEVVLSHQRILESGKNAIYNYKRTEVKNYLLPNGLSSYSWDNICNGLLPEFILFAMTPTSAYNGSFLSSPFDFKHYDIESFSVTVNGIEVSPRNLSFNFDYSNPQSQIAYFNLFKQLNLHRFDSPNIINRNFFNNGGFILAYDLTPDKSIGCSNIVNNGSVRAECKLRKPLPEPITVLAYLQYDSELIIDKMRSVFPAYT